MATISVDYPHKLNDDELEKAILEYSIEIFNKQGNINAVMLYSPLIQLGQNELQGRQTKRATRLSVGASLLSIIIAFLALYISLSSSRASARWESDQLEILEQISNGITTTNDELGGIFREEAALLRSSLADLQEQENDSTANN
jgi:hypothetical protein